jgi:Glycosyl transferases group 1
MSRVRGCATPWRTAWERERREIDVLIASPGTTLGLRGAAHDLFATMLELGIDADLVTLPPRPLGRLGDLAPLALTDLGVAARLRWEITKRLRHVRPRAFVYGTSIATVLEPGDRLRVSAVRFDQLAAVNRPGVRNALTRFLERRRLRMVRILLPCSSASELPPGLASIPLPPPVRPWRNEQATRERDFFCYAADPHKKGLDLIVEAWGMATIRNAKLIITGIDADAGRAFLQGAGVVEPSGLSWAGRLSPDRYRSVTSSLAAHITASRREEWGIAALEALADGALLVAVPGAWRTEVVELARDLDPHLVAADRSPEALAVAMRHAHGYSEDDRDAYQGEARARVGAYSPETFRSRVRDAILPILLDVAGHPASGRR